MFQQFSELFLAKFTLFSAIPHVYLFTGDR